MKRYLHLTYLKRPVLIIASVFFTIAKMKCAAKGNNFKRL